MNENNITEQLASILNDPEGLEKIKKAAAGILGENMPAAENNGGSETLIDPITLSKMMSVLNSSKGDSRTALLSALKPHLSPEKAARVDNAIKLLRLVPLLPMIKQFF